MAALEWRQGGVSRGRLELREGEFLRLGRGEAADGRVDGDPYMSRLHVEVVLDRGTLRVRKLPNASNPVIHGGAEKTDFRMEPGESFMIGGTAFHFLAEKTAAPPPAAAVPAEAAPRPEEWAPRLERYFSPRVVGALLAGRDLAVLDPKPVESTILRLDLRGFSKAAELGPDEVLAVREKLRRVMTAMTEELFKEDGVLLQYAGDGLQACWNAPFPSADHADRACRAALAMTRRLAEIDPELRCGIGLQTGRVVAGTDGSDQIFAYGVIGAAVAQAARVEGLTKLVGAPVLATRDVVDRLSDASGIAATPLGKFRSAGMAADFDLYEIAAGPPDPDRLAAFEDAEAALAAGAWDAAVEALKGPAARDAAARYLLGFAEKCLRTPPRNWSGVIELGEK